MGLIAGRYEPIGVLGGGGQGTVLRARDVRHDRTVAIKVRPSGDVRVRDELLREARVLLHMRPHPGVVLVRDDLFAGDDYHLVMDHVDGPALSDAVPMSWDAAIPVVSDLAAALDHLHSHDPPVVHGDVKPSNVVLRDGRPVLVDFGIAGLAGRGTRGYVAPEVLDGAPATPSSDVFSVAATAWAMLCGRPPSPGVPPQIASLPGSARILAVFSGGLAMEPSGRPASAGAFAAALAGAVPAVRALFMSDVEGSTTLWDAEPDAMSAAIARHAQLVEAIVHAHGGRLPTTHGEGDSVFASFGRPRDAIAAAVAVQHALAREPWPTAQPLRVRIGLHAGPVEERDGDLFGTHVNRCARVRGLGHGGQILVSSSAAMDLPDGVTLRDLGSHRLKGLREPERVNQVCAPGLPDTFDPLHSPDAGGSNLPSAFTTFVGRERELGTLTAAIDTSRLVTLTGPGGAGKTRLAIEAAGSISMPGGVWFADLSGVTGDVPRAVAAALGIADRPGRSDADALAAHLSGRRTLVVADNCEHVLDGAARLTSALLAACAELTVLATSRQPLGLPGERVVPLGPLGLPDDDPLGSDAVRLFVDRATAADPAFEPGDMQDVVRICRRLDGLPLAIELAAARVRAFPLGELASRLELLEAGPGVPGRHRTLRAAIAWSIGLLDDGERDVLAKLGVFEGAFTLAAADAVCGADAAAVASLVDRSLVQPARGGRHRLLQTIRDHARQLGPADTAAHAAYFAREAELASEGIAGPDQASWLQRLDAEREDLDAAMGVRPGMAVGLRRWWAVRGRWREGLERLEAHLAHGPDPEASVAAGTFATLLGDHDAAARHLDAAALSGDPSVLAEVLVQRAESLRLRGDPDAARIPCREAVAMLGADPRALGRAEMLMGVLELVCGDVSAADGWERRALDRFARAGDRRLEARARNNLARVLSASGRPDDAIAECRVALDVLTAFGDLQGAAEVRHNLGVLALQRDAADPSARAELEAALDTFREVGDRSGAARVLFDLAQAVYLSGDAADAEARFGECMIEARASGDAETVSMCAGALEALARERADATVSPS